MNRNNLRITSSTRTRKYNATSTRNLYKRKYNPAHKSLLRSRLSKYIKNERVEKFLWSSFGFLGIVAVIGAVGFLFWLNKITNELPNLDRPYDGLASSTIYDRNGVVLYTVSASTFSRNPISTSEVVPETLKWAFLSAEDKTFYEHPGISFMGIARCILVYANILPGDICGASTITQQVVQNSKVITRERTVTRKVKDIILSLQLERKYTKDEILNFYLNLVPEGGGRLGARTGAELYFGKDIDELSLPEMTVLAAVVNNPTTFSPTIGADLEANKVRLFARTDYIFDQMLENIDRINEGIDKANEKYKDQEGYVKQEHITPEQIEKAKGEVKNLTFLKPSVQIKAAHFVFYVKDLLKQRNYHNGVPFTETEIENGGLKIYTTLDYSLQEVAEEYVSSSQPYHAGFYRNKFGAKNSALMTIRPSTGEILTMVGSKCYSNNEFIPNCEDLDVSEGTLFDSKVNVLDTLQSPGSTNKILNYYIGFREGLISTSSILPDVPITAIPGYNPKNWNGAFIGKQDVRYVFAKSLNLPALFLVDAYGPDKYVETAKQFHYTTYTNQNGYGPSVVLGGADVKAIEHAQGIGVFANGGNLVQHEAILKITDSENKIIFEYKPEPIPVADPAAVYLVNNVLNPRTSPGLSPVQTILDRDVAGKTGTSENNKDNWYVVYSPEFVTIAWMGNNDNTRLAGGSFGSTGVVPWTEAYMKSIMGAFPEKKQFIRPSNIVSAGGNACGDANTPDDGCLSEYGLAVAGKGVPSYLSKKKAMVCIDQQDRLARPIDIAAGFSVEKEFVYLTSPSPRLQKDVDTFFAEKGLGVPIKECDILRTSDPNKPEGIFIQPQPGKSYEGSLPIDARAFSGSSNVTRIEFVLGGNIIASADAGNYSNTVDISSYGYGPTTLTMNIYDDKGNSSSASINVFIGKVEGYGSISLNASPQVNANETLPVGLTYEGNIQITNVTLYQINNLTNVTSVVGNMRMVDENHYEYTWVSGFAGDYQIYAVAQGEGFSLTSNATTVKVNPVAITTGTATPVTGADQG